MIRGLFVSIFCAGLSAVTAQTLHVYTWADYISPQALESFEKKHSCRVVVDTFDSNEAMYAKLKAGAGGYDVIFPTSYIIPLMEREGMLAPLDHALLPHRVNLDPTVLDKISDRAMRHGVPYTVGYTLLAARRGKVPTREASWALLLRPELHQRLTLLDDMRETIGAALKALGHSINTTDDAQLSSAQALLLRWKAQAAKFDNEGYKAGLDSGEFLLVHGYSGDLWQVAQENDKIEIILPREGVIMGCDEMVIPSRSTQKELAHAFLDHLLQAEIAAENMQWTGYLCPNQAALKQVEPGYLANPAISIPDEVKASSEVIRDLGPDLEKYIRVWDAVKR
jgi:spermidine/putrescine transport system substrate-binding protein